MSCKLTCTVVDLLNFMSLNEAIESCFWFCLLLINLLVKDWKGYCVTCSFSLCFSFYYFFPQILFLFRYDLCVWPSVTWCNWLIPCLLAYFPFIFILIYINIYTLTSCPIVWSVLFFIYHSNFLMIIILI